MEIKTDNEKVISKYRRYVSAKGIFYPKTRAKLLGIKTQGRETAEPFKTSQEKANFWYRRRNEVKGCLKDLELFIEVANKNSVNEVITLERLKPLVEALLLRPVWKNAEPDLERAEIAKLFIHAGFEYLMQMQKIYIREYDATTINNAREEANFLIDLFRPLDERRHVSPLERPR